MVMTSRSAGEAGLHLIQAIVSLANHVIAGGVPSEIRPIFFGASLLALNKRTGGIRPIAIGLTLRRLVAKVACLGVVSSIGEYLSPLQLGFGTRLGSEAAVHCSRANLRELPSDHAMIKLDFRNAFNCIRRDIVLQTVAELIPELYAFVHSCYSEPSHLFYHDTLLLSQEGVQQGDPLGPLLFCLAIHPLILRLQSELSIFYLDDGLIGGSVDDRQKSELICISPHDSPVLRSIPDLIPIHPKDASFLGAPIGNTNSINSAIVSKCNDLRTVGERLPHFQKHDSLLLLRHSFAIPKILYVLRVSPCFRSPELGTFDNLLRRTTSAILNVDLSADRSWFQATLPISKGGIGIRRAVQLAPSAFLASAAGCHSLCLKILPSRLHNLPVPDLVEALSIWKSTSPEPPPTSPAKTQQKAWEGPQTSATFTSLLEQASSGSSRARILSASSGESGAWLNALPVSSLGLRMDDDTVTISVGLCLGVSLCRPHLCRQCGAQVDEFATHRMWDMSKVPLLC